MPKVGFHETIGQETIERCPGRFFGGVAEHPLRALVKKHNALFLIDQDYGVMGRVKYLGERIGRD